MEGYVAWRYPDLSKVLTYLDVARYVINFWFIFVELEDVRLANDDLSVLEQPHLQIISFTYMRIFDFQ